MNSRIPGSSDGNVFDVELDLESVKIDKEGRAAPPAEQQGRTDRLSADRPALLRIQAIGSPQAGRSDEITAVLARLATLMDELAAIRRDSVESGHRGLAATARLAAVFGELATIREEVRRNSDLLARTLAPLLKEHRADPSSERLASYQEISPGVRIGFAHEAAADLVCRPCQGDAALVATCSNVLDISLQAPGTWVSIETTLDAYELADAKHYTFGLGARLDRRAGCRILLRFFENGGPQDIPLGELQLDPQETGYTMTGTFELQRYSGNANLIVIFSPQEPPNDRETALHIALGQMNFMVT